MIIDKDDMTTLQDAATIIEVSETAPSEIEEQSIAYEINNAANTGETSVLYLHKISDAMIEKLEGLGYTVERYKDIEGEPTRNQYIISAEATE